MADLDRDLRSIHEARALGRAARAAQAKLESASQEHVDAIVEAMAAAGKRENEHLAAMAVEETGYGNTEGKVAKNAFVLELVVEAMRGMPTVGVIAEDAERRVREIAEPVGVVAGIIPTTNPTSTAMFKALIALKARCGIVLSPHPNAKSCIKASADVMHEAAVAAGAPRGIIGCMTVVSMEGTRELMNGRETDVILATGGMGLVRAAYSAGKPAYGVGPGNVPAYIERTADVAAAARDIVAGTTFDNGTLCSSEQAIICDRVIREQVVAAVKAQGGYFLSPAECDRLAAVLITEKLLVHPDLVGQSAMKIAAAAGISVPEGTRVLVCPQGGVGRDYPLSHEKLSPVLAFYEVEDWKQGCERCKQLLQFGGLGHSMVIHSRDDDVVLQFGLYKPAHRVLVNTVAAVGAVGLTTGLFPSMTLGCGSWGNNITSDNIGPQHLLNVKRLAYGIRPFDAPQTGAGASTSASTARGAAASGASASGSVPAPSRAGAGNSAPARAGIDVAGSAGGGRGGPPMTGTDGDLRARVDDFLRDRGIIAPASRPSATTDHGDGCGCEHCGPDAERSPTEAAPWRGASVTGKADKAHRGARKEPGAPAPVDFVSEMDVRDAMKRGETIRIGPKTIITPLAHELGEQHDVFQRR